MVNFTEIIACRQYVNSNGTIKIFLSSFTKGNLFDDSVTDINPKFPRPCPGIEMYIVTSAFERYFGYLDYMFPELVTFPPSAELIQDLFLARFIPKLRGVY